MELRVEPRDDAWMDEVHGTWCVRSDGATTGVWIAAFALGVAVPWVFSGLAMFAGWALTLLVALGVTAWLSRRAAPSGVLVVADGRATLDGVVLDGPEAVEVVVLGAARQRLMRRLGVHASGRLYVSDRPPARLDALREALTRPAPAERGGSR